MKTFDFAIAIITIPYKVMIGFLKVGYVVMGTIIIHHFIKTII